MEIQRQKIIMEAFSSMKTTDNIKIEDLNKDGIFWQ